MQSSAASLLEDSVQSSRDVLRPSGALDRSSSHQLREAIGGALSQGPATLVIDLSGVSNVDAVGLAVLVYACRAARAAHAKLVVSSPSRIVLQVLAPARLSDLCDFELELAVPVPIRGTAA